MDTNSIEGKIEAMRAKIDELEKEARQKGRGDLFDTLKAEWQEKLERVKDRLDHLNDPAAGRSQALASEMERSFEELRDSLRKAEKQLA